MEPIEDNEYIRVIPHLHDTYVEAFCMGWIVLPPDSYVETLTPSVSERDCIWKQSLCRRVKLKWGPWGGSWSNVTGGL